MTDSKRPIVTIRPIVLSPEEMFFLAEALDELWDYRARDPNAVLDVGGADEVDDPLVQIYQRLHNDELEIRFASATSYGKVSS